MSKKSFMNCKYSHTHDKHNTIQYTQRLSKELIEMKMYSYEEIARETVKLEATKYNNLFFERLFFINQHDWNLWKKINNGQEENKYYKTTLEFNETIIGRIAQAFPEDEDCARRKPYGDFKQFAEKEHLTRKDVYEAWAQRVETPIKNGRTMLDVAIQGFYSNEMKLKGESKYSSLMICRAYSLMLYKLADGLLKEFWVLKQLQKAFKNCLDGKWEVRAAASERETEDVDAEVWYDGVFVTGISIKCGGAFGFESLNTFRNVYGKNIPEWYCGIVSKEIFENLVEIHENNDLKSIDKSLRVSVKDSSFNFVSFKDWVKRLEVKKNEVVGVVEPQDIFDEVFAGFVK